MKMLYLQGLIMPIWQRHVSRHIPLKMVVIASLSWSSWTLTWRNSSNWNETWLPHDNSFLNLKRWSLLKANYPKSATDAHWWQEQCNYPFLECSKWDYGYYGEPACWDKYRRICKAHKFQKAIGPTLEKFNGLIIEWSYDMSCCMNTNVLCLPKLKTLLGFWNLFYTWTSRFAQSLQKSWVA